MHGIRLPGATTDPHDFFSVAIAARITDRPRSPCRLLQESVPAQQIKLFRRCPADLVCEKDRFRFFASQPELMNQVAHDAMFH
jgi:hypothetical protein